MVHKTCGLSLASSLRNFDHLVGAKSEGVLRAAQWGTLLGIYVHHAGRMMIHSQILPFA